VIIMGIDPGIAIVGYGVVEYKDGRFKTLAYGAITTPAHTPVECRLKQVYDDLDRLIKKYRPAHMAVEELFFTNNQKTAISVAQARGVILLAAMNNSVEIHEYTPLQVKQSVVGYGRATKAQIMTMVKILLNLERAPRLDDTADALAIAICHAHSNMSGLRDFYNLPAHKL